MKCFRGKVLQHLLPTLPSGGDVSTCIYEIQTRSTVLYKWFNILKKQTKEVISDCVKCSTEHCPLYLGDVDTQMMQHFKYMLSTSVITSLSQSVPLK